MDSGLRLPSKEAARRGKANAHIAAAQQLVVRALTELECAETYGDPADPDPLFEDALDYLKAAAEAVDGLQGTVQRRAYYDRAFPIR